MGKFDGVLIASDLDGTLLSSDHTISERNLEKIRYFQENGGTFTIATGRTPMRLDSLVEKIKLQVPIILSNGAVIFDTINQTYIKKEVVGCGGYDFIEKVKEIDSKIGCDIYTPDEFYVVHETEFPIHDYVQYCFSGEKMHVNDVPHSDNWLKVNFTHKDKHRLKPVEDFFRENYEGKYQFCYSCSEFFEITNINARKDIALIELAEKYGFDREHIYTAGDNFNDYYMLKYAKMGFAPLNSEYEIKEISDKVVCSNDDGVIADVIEHLDTIY